MEELIHIIENLLKENCCVVVPGFGAFIHQDVRATIKGNLLYPPHTTLSFNSQIRDSDGLIERVYAQKYHTDYISARRALKGDIQNLTDTLRHTGSIRMGRIGEFTMEGENYTFHPSACSFLPQNLALQPIALQKQVENTVTIRIKKDYLRYAAACIIGIGLLGISPRINNENSSEYASLRPIEYSSIIASLHPTEEPEEETVTKERGHFHIVVASLDKQSADKTYRRLQEQGYTESTIIPYKKNLYRVVLSSYFSKREALRAMEDVRRTTSYKRAWVYCE